MKQVKFINTYLPPAKLAGEKFRINPVVILAQAIIESGWGTSTLSTRYFNFFGITGYGKRNEYWQGHSVQLGEKSLQFRTYATVQDSFYDYARLIRSAYSPAADMSYHPEAFAKEIAYSKYISEVNGDNREVYRRSIVSLCKTIESVKPMEN